MKDLHASKMPLYVRCPGAAHAEGIAIDFPNPAADVGTEVHGNLSTLLRDGALPDMEGVDDEVRALSFIGRKWWNEYSGMFPDVVVEVPQRAAIGGVVICGTPDAVSVEGDLVRIPDWKTTRLDDVTYGPQLMTCLWLYIATHGNDCIEAGQYIIIYLRDKTHEVSRRFTRDEILEWADREIRERIINWDGTYHPGAHCRYCPAFSQCEARTAIMRSTALALAEGAGVPSTGIELLDLYHRVQIVEKAVSDFKAQVRLEVEASGGSIDCGDATLILVDSSRSEIDVAAAWGHLRAALSDDELAQCLAIHKGELMKQIAAGAPRGEKGTRRKEFMEILEAAGAVKTTTQKQLRILKKKGADDDAGGTS